MISKLNEGPMRTVLKVDPTGAIHDQEMARRKAETLRQDRPVEHTASGEKADAKYAEKDDSSAYLMEENKVVFEKYNKSGDVVYRLPPSVKPIDERV